MRDNVPRPLRRPILHNLRARHAREAGSIVDQLENRDRDTRPDRARWQLWATGGLDGSARTWAIC